MGVKQKSIHTSLQSLNCLRQDQVANISRENSLEQGKEGFDFFLVSCMSKFPYFLTFVLSLEKRRSQIPHSWY